MTYLQWVLLEQEGLFLLIDQLPLSEKASTAAVVVEEEQEELEAQFLKMNPRLQLTMG